METLPGWYPVMEGVPPTIPATPRTATWSKSAPFPTSLSTWSTLGKSRCPSCKTRLGIDLECFGFFFSMQKEARQRPKYSKLLQHPFLLRSQTEQVDVSAYVQNIFQRIETLGLTVADLQMDWFGEKVIFFPTPPSYPKIPFLFYKHYAPFFVFFFFSLFSPSKKKDTLKRDWWI